MLEAFLNHVDRSIYRRSGSVFYSGRSAFSQASDIYVLGLNPGGSPIVQARETIERDIAMAHSARTEWSAYLDES